MRHRFPLPTLFAAALLLLLPLALACDTGPDTGDGTVATDGTTEEAAADDYAERMSEEHADDRPVPGFAREEGRFDDVEVATERVEYTTGDGGVTGYLAMPEGAGTRPEPGLPGILVIHEWWGLNENVETMARLLARRGYVALAVDLYEGQAADSPERARELMQNVDEAAAEENLRQAYQYLVREHGVPQVGVIGWCFGGGWSLRTALLMPEEIDAAVIYYGRLVQDRERLAELDMPILGLFGADDQGIPVEDVRQFESTLQDLGKDVTIEVYEGAGHAFANPSGERYQPEAAKDAWKKTVAFLDRHLKGGDVEGGGEGAAGEGSRNTAGEAAGAAAGEVPEDVDIEAPE